MSAFETAVKTIQFLAADAVQQANSGHPGTPMALAGITTEIFSEHLRYQPEDPSWPNRDRFVLSCGHASMLLYSVLHLAGYPVSKDDLVNFRQLDSKTPGHPEFGHTVGVETTTGPLGQGVSTAVGMALSARLGAARVGPELLDYRVYVLASDGDLMEGVASEAASLAGHWGLGNLIVVYDANNITIDGKAEVAFSEDVGKRFEAYGWGVQQVDGHAPEQVHAAIEAAKADAGRPSLIVAKTRIGIGCPTKENTSAAHGSPLGRDEINAAKAAAGWPQEEFVVPKEAYAPFEARRAAVKAEYDAWQARRAALSGEALATWESLFEQHAPSDLYERLLAAAHKETKAMATRASGSLVEQVAASCIASLVSGSADLNASTKTDITGGGYVTREDFSGRNLRYGIREHAMGAIATGIALSGFIPVTSTFLIFSEYMRPPIRLAAMMELQSVYVFTHDSFFVGEDGPTHQPVEQVSALRLIPNVDVMRPADVVECAVAWAHALERKDGPTVLALTRQNLPYLSRPESLSPETMRRGGYVLRDAEEPTLVLMATGSEVWVAVEAAALLEEAGHRVRVVSMPCLDVFLREPAEYQKQVLGTAPRISLEAGSTHLWKGVVGLDGLCIGLDHYGASAPAEQLQERFGLTPAQVAARVREAFPA